jgi:hypothetical protein
MAHSDHGRPNHVSNGVELCPLLGVKRLSCGRLSLTATDLISTEVGRIIPRIKAFASIPVSIFAAVRRTCIHPTGGQSTIGRGRVNLGIGCNYDIGWSRRRCRRLRRYCVRLRSVEIGLRRVGIRLRGVGASLIAIPWGCRGNGNQGLRRCGIDRRVIPPSVIAIPSGIWVR